MLTDTRKSPYAKAMPLGSRDVVWTDGFWKDVENATFAATVPELQQMFDSKDISHVVENFRIAAGEHNGSFDGTVFGDGDFYKWMESAMYDAVKTGNSGLLGTLDRYIDLIGRAQQPDGYLSTKQIIGEKESNGVHRMGDINDFEVYNFGHLFTAAALYYRLTGKDNLLKIASKTADYLERMYSEAKKKGEIQTAVCPSHYMGLVELYRATGDRKYLQLAKEAVDLRDSVRQGMDDNQDRIPLRTHRKIIGHAVRANYLYAGVADLYLENGDTDYREVLDSVWKDLLTHKIYITGGCGALYNGASPYGNFMDHQLIHQAYGYAYQLPNVTAYNETCANIGLVMWAYRMFLANPKAEYFDVIERVMLNTNLAAVSLDGLKFFYENMLAREKRLDYQLIWELHRTNYITSYCCPPNLARNLAEATEYAYAVSTDRHGDTPDENSGTPVIYIGLYGSSRAAIKLTDGAEFELIQTTQYPYEGAIEFTTGNVTVDAPVILALRIPVWAQHAKVTVHTSAGDEVRVLGEEAEGTYFYVSLQHIQGSSVTLELPMEVRYTVANDLVEEDQGKAAVERGPLVFCMETADATEKHSGVDSLHELSLSFENGKGPSGFTEKHIEIDGRDILALEGNMVRNTGTDSGEKLYRRVKPVEVSSVPVQLIPYFAWDNRSAEADNNAGADDDEMKIWFPVII